MVRFFQGVLISLALVAMGCAPLRPGYVEPEVELVNFKPLPSQEFEQQFLLGLRILNPNDQSLPLTGLSYRLNVQGHKVVSGATGDLPEIAPFSDTVIEVRSSASLLGGVRVISELVSKPEQPLEYELEVRLHSAWWPIPLLIVESGAFGAGL